MESTLKVILQDEQLRLWEEAEKGIKAHLTIQSTIVREETQAGIGTHRKADALNFKCKSKMESAQRTQEKRSRGISDWGRILINTDGTGVSRAKIWWFRCWHGDPLSSIARESLVLTDEEDHYQVPGPHRPGSVFEKMEKVVYRASSKRQNRAFHHYSPPNQIIVCF